MSSNKEYFNMQADAVRATSLSADGEQPEIEKLPIDKMGYLISIGKTLGACLVVLGIGMGAFKIINSITNK